MTYDRQKVINIALAEDGYLEKASNSQLDSKTANAGKNNYTKYARDLDSIGFYNGRKNGHDWCDVFVDWCFVQAYGKDAALALTCQPTKAADNCGAGCRYSMNYYKKKGQFYTSNPQPGDQIFFYSKDKSSISHTGLVCKVSGSKVYTVEGNTTSESGVIANGGAVRANKSYSLTYARIAGYGRPKYGAQNGAETPPASSEQKDKETPAQNATGATAATTGGKAVTVTLTTLKNGSKGPEVKTLQRNLNALGYDCGDVDGSLGPKTLAALKAFQKAKGLEVDGYCGQLTWTALLK